MRVYWLEQTEKDVPASDDWLCAREVTCMNNLRIAKRRADWRLGRWTAKRAVAVCLGWPLFPQILARIEIHATPSGAPEAIIASFGTPMVVSLSHRAGRAMCAVAPAGVLLGCDLEVIEPRSKAFIADYFTPEEQCLVARSPSAAKPEIATLLWSAKECALKALREGLRLDTRSVMVSPMAGSPDVDGWGPIRVKCTDNRVFHGWWRTAGEILYTMAADPTPDCPIFLALPPTQRNPEYALDFRARSTTKPEIQMAS